MLDYIDLEKLGLNKNEAMVFVELVKAGEVTGGELIKKTGFHRNIVYDNLEKLVDKGLVSFIVKDGVRQYMVSAPEAIEEFFEVEQKKFEERQKIAERISKSVAQQIKKLKHKPKAQLFQGFYGIKTIFGDTLTVGEDYVSFGAPGESVPIPGEKFWRNYETKRIHQKINARLIFNEELRGWGKTILNKYTKLKYLPRELADITQTMIYGNKTAIMIWTDKPIIVLIEDENVAKAYKKYFEVLWKLAKR